MKQNTEHYWKESMLVWHNKSRLCVCRVWSWTSCTSDRTRSTSLTIMSWTHVETCNQSSKLSKYIQKSLLALLQSTLNRTAGPKKRQTCKMTSTKTLSGIYHSSCIYLVYLFSKWTKLTSLMLTHLPPVSQTRLKLSPRLKCKSELFQLK